MRIDLNNYEEWAIDYIEGTIPADMRDSFELFLAQNPDVKSNIESLIDDMPTLNANEISYPHKEELLRGRRFLTRQSIGVYISGAVAAAILLGFFISIPEQDSNRLVAERGVVESEHEITKYQSVSGEQAKEVNNSLSKPSVAKGAKQAVPTIVETTPKFAQKVVEQVKSKAATIDKETKSTITISNHENIVLAQADIKPIAQDINLVNPTIELSAPQTLAYISDNEMVHVPIKDDGVDIFRRALAKFIAPIDRLNPIKVYKTETGHGIEIASRYKIGKE